MRVGRSRLYAGRLGVLRRSEAKRCSRGQAAKGECCCAPPWLSGKSSSARVLWKHSARVKYRLICPSLSDFRLVCRGFAEIIAEVGFSRQTPGLRVATALTIAYINNYISTNKHRIVSSSPPPKLSQAIKKAATLLIARPAAGLTHVGTRGKQCTSPFSSTYST